MTQNEQQKEEDKKKQQPPQEMSLGEKWFNRILYQGMNYWLNLGISLFVTDVFMHGKGHDFFKRSVNKTSDALTKFTGMSKSFSKWFAGQALGAFSLNSGGNLLLFPTWLAENNKRGIVHWLNDKLGVSQIAPDGHKMTKDEIYIEQEQDPQSLSRMAGRRFIGWGATTATGMALDQLLKKKVNPPVVINGELHTHIPGQEVYTDFTKNAVDKGLRFVKADKIADNDTFRRYVGYGALDWIYTMITSKLMHMTNGAKSKHAPDEIDGQQAIPAATPVEEPSQAPEPSSRKVKEIIENRSKHDSLAKSVTASRTGAHMHMNA